MPATETFAFQAETRQLLDLVVHSLYTHEEIFLRELVSNASDAIDKLRYEVLTGSSAGEASVEPGDLAIRLEVDPDARLLRVVDPGIGMSRDEVVENLGTIARSGTKAFLEVLKAAEETPSALPELIGQFGVGFYASFMVAEEVELETKRAGEAKGVRWRSRGDGEYTLEEVERDACGTTVTLHLKPLDSGDGEVSTDYTQTSVLRGIVKRYSDFIEYPIEMEVGEGDDRKVEVLNSMKPLWTRPRSEITDEEYAEFYKHHTHDWHEPLETIHFKAEGSIEYTALLYLPKERPLDLFDPSQTKSRVHLYVKRVFIMADCEELSAPWLRFVRGVVDSADLPLNVSRETLQHDRRTRQIQSRVTRKVLDALKRLLADRREDYTGFWNAFGPVLKEGIYYDEENKEEVAGLALFASTAGDEVTTLAEYVERMPVAQKEIYVLLAPDLETARRSPHLEAATARGREVLFLTDPVDEFVLQRLSEFQERPLKRIDRGEVDFDDEDEKEAREAKEKELEPVLEAVRKELADDVSDVRFSSRLTESPACLVGGEHDLSPQMRRILEESGQSVPETKRTLELNATHPMTARLQELVDTDYARFGEACELVLGLALVAEGGSPKDPAGFTRLVSALFVQGDPKGDSEGD